MEIGDLTGLGKLADSRLVNKVYNHTVAEAAKETGATAADIAKTFRLLLAPFQLAAVAQDRFAKWLDQIRSRVPVERQVEAAPSVAGPAIQSLMFLEDDNPLVEMFLTLLTKAIDKDHAEKAHPAFVQVLNQLSPDEATIVAILNRDGWYALNYSDKYVCENDFPLEQLGDRKGFAMYVSHLKALGIVAVARQRETFAKVVGPPHYIERQGPLGPATISVQDLVYLTTFGRSFAAACTPSPYQATEATSAKMHKLEMLSGFEPAWIVH